jgi:hypothetical protein
MSRIKIKEVVKQHPAKLWKENKHFHEFDCEGTVDGNDASFKISAMSIGPTLSSSPPVGEEFDAEFKNEYQGVKQYNFRAQSKGGGGGFKGAPRNENHIIAQNALTQSNSYFACIGSKDHAPEDVMELAGRFLEWVKKQ